MVTPDGVQTLHTYDVAGNETATRVKNLDGTLVTSTSTLYNKHGQTAQMTDALGTVTKYTPFGTLISFGGGAVFGGGIEYITQKFQYLDMNERSMRPPEVIGLYRIKKWYQFWGKTIKIKN